MNVEIGSAYDLSDIAGNEQVLWVCLSRSPANDQIMNLSPTVSEQPQIPAVEVRSDSGQTAWLIPAISVAVHRNDLETRAVASRFELIPADFDTDSFRSIEGFPNRFVDSLREAAWEISQYFQTNPERQVIPDIDDCFVLEEDRSSGILTFVWRHDVNRHYALRADSRGDVSLNQYYESDIDLQQMANAPLKVGSKIIAFADDGSAVEELGSSESSAIRSALGLETLKAAREDIQRSHSGISAILQAVLGGRRAAAVAAVIAAGIIGSVILLQQISVPKFEINNAYATTDIRSGTSVQLGIILELLAADVSESTDYFADALKDAGVAVTVELLPGGEALVTGIGNIGTSETLRELLDERGLDVEGREFIEIVIQPME